MRKKYLMFLLVLSGFPFASMVAQDTLSVNFTGVDSSLNGQNLTLYLRNPTTGDFLDSLNLSPIDSTDFTLTFDSVESGSYFLDFFSDVNNNGRYDSPPDNSWRIELDSFAGDTNIIWMYDTNYVDITWESDTTDTTGGDTSLVNIGVNFNSFDPHIGQNMYLYLREPGNGEKIDSLFVTPVDSAEFAIVFDSVDAGSYNVDFWVDMDSNGTYDTPPQDHAWRIELMDLQKDTIVDFMHNTDFVDIFPEEDTTGGDSTIALTVDFVGFDSVVDQNLVVYLRDPQTNDFVDSVKVSPVDSNEFTIVFNDVDVNNNYNIDFYSDANGNGSYDAPPTDFAWRIQVVNIVADTTIMFMFDTVYTDIGLGGEPTPVGQVDGDADFTAFPNPVQNELNVSLSRGGTGLSIYNVTGALVLHKNLTSTDRLVRLNVSALKPGMYILRLNTPSGSSQMKFMKE